MLRLHDFLRPVAPLAAKRIVQDLVRAPRRLIDNPRLGQRANEAPEIELRRLVIGDYEMRYEVTDDVIYVVRIWHGRENR